MDPVAVVGTDFHYIVLYSSADSKDSKLALVHALSKKVPPSPLAAWRPLAASFARRTDLHRPAPGVCQELRVRVQVVWKEDFHADEKWRGESATGRMIG